VLKGGLCAYGWVKILLYYLCKNEHISFILTPTPKMDRWSRREMYKVSRSKIYGASGMRLL
jgi:hypothetical protein